MKRWAEQNNPYFVHLLVVGGVFPSDCLIRALTHGQFVNCNLSVKIWQKKTRWIIDQHADLENKLDTIRKTNIVIVSICLLSVLLKMWLTCRFFGVCITANWHFGKLKEHFEDVEYSNIITVCWCLVYLETAMM